MPVTSFDLVSLLIVIGTTLAAGFLRGFVGFGAAMINVPVLSLVVGPVPAVWISALIGLPAVFQLLPAAIRESEPRIVGPMCAAVFLTTPVGVWVLISLDPEVVKIAIAVLVLAMVLLLARGWRLPAQVGVGVLLGAGTVGGLVQGLAGIGGPPVVAVALSRAGPPARQRGNVLALMSAVSLSSLLPLYSLGLFTRDVLLASAVLFPVYAATTWLGARCFSTGGQRIYRRAALLTLAAVGMVTLALSIRALLVS